ncbi:hypothetical protein LPJ74_005573 [Coemansia sp. RSA 1843]|nr:hypothetical protein LPJ74_005573 [Coemansia sp. RSA 1843]
MASINPHLPISELQAGLISGKWTSVDLVEAYLARIAQFKHYNAMIFVKDRQSLLFEAALLDKERSSLVETKILHGIPVVIKDNICTSDMPTTVGTLSLKNAESGFDAEIVRRLRNAGAIIIGKANMSEFFHFCDNYLLSGWSCMGGQTLNAISGSAHPGGSSSGSACAAALGLAAATIGSETEGSIIIPSMNQSVVGIKPSRGLCSSSGTIPISTTFDVLGPICRNVEDAAAMLEVISEEDIKFTKLHAFNIRGARAGITLNHGSSLNSNDSAHVAYHFASFVFNSLRDLGCVVLHNDVVSDGVLSSHSYNTIKDLAESIGKDYAFVLGCELKDGIGKMLSKFSNIPSGVNDLKSLVEFNKQNPESLNPLISDQENLLNVDKTGGFNDPNRDRWVSYYLYSSG